VLLLLSLLDTTQNALGGLSDQGTARFSTTPWDSVVRRCRCPQASVDRPSALPIGRFDGVGLRRAILDLLRPSA
jgi:hypothetical protein